MRSSGDSFEKKAFWSTLTFYLFVAVSPLQVGINVDMRVLVMYFLICHIVLLLALFIYSFHLLALAHVISSLYSFTLSFHVALFTTWFVQLNMFLSQFNSFHSLDRSAVH